MIEKTTTIGELLKNAPSKDEGMFRIPVEINAPGEEVEYDKVDYQQ